MKTLLSLCATALIFTACVEDDDPPGCTDSIDKAWEECQTDEEPPDFEIWAKSKLFAAGLSWEDATTFCASPYRLPNNVERNTLNDLAYLKVILYTSPEGYVCDSARCSTIPKQVKFNQDTFVTCIQDLTR